MKILIRELKFPYNILMAIFCLMLSLVICYVDIKFLPNDITLLLPYILILSFVTLFIGNRTGFLFSVLTISLWLTAKTEIFTTHSLSIYLDIILKSVFIFLQYFFMLYLKRLYFKVEALSFNDELTGLKNRKGFFTIAQYAINKSNRNNECLSMLYLDIDNLKYENDTKGHKEGDKVIKALSETIMSATRNIDVSARIGGDEFCILLPNVDQEESKQIINRMVDKYFQLCLINNWKASLSIGVYTTKSNLTLEQLIKQSDDLMYEAKKSGKNTIKYGGM